VTTTRPDPPAIPRVRALAPDLARGAMLALIALAHSQVLAGRTIGTAVVAGSALDTAVQAVLTLLVDSRGYPMFAALFGYGMVQILRLQEPARGWEGARTLLRRRGGWLVVFGFCHALLLFTGDILAAYGLLALLLVGALRRPDKWLLTAAGVACIAGAVAYGAVLSVPVPTGDASQQLTDPLVSAVFRLATFPVLTPLNAIMAAGPVLIGVWAARRRLLEEPERHRALLGRVAAGGIAIAVLGAVPQMLVTTGAWSPPAPALFAVGALHTACGYAGGLGYAALIGLVAARFAAGRADGPRPGRLMTALGACGQRSMSCYLAQSVAWLLLFEPYLADLGGELGVAAAAGVGLGVWVLTVMAAGLLHRADRPGPAEALLRRLTYGGR
jgi:uncharacterized protein